MKIKLDRTAFAALTIAALSAAPLAAHAYAGPQAAAPAPAAIATPTSGEVARVLNEGFSEFAQVQGAMAARRYGEAMTLAKALLDRVKVATGVDPTVQLTQPVRTRGAFAADALGFALGDLVFPTQERIKIAVRNHQGGLYVDLINLAKRAHVQWVGAQFFRIRADGRLLETDRRHLTGNLTGAYHYAIYVQDEFVPQGPLMISDMEVADADKIRYFNREIEVLVQSLPEIGWTPEGFVAEADRAWQERVAQHRRSVGGVGWYRGRSRGVDY